jgi:hypothetical protein
MCEENCCVKPVELDNCGVLIECAQKQTFRLFLSFFLCHKSISSNTPCGYHQDYPVFVTASIYANRVNRQLDRNIPWRRTRNIPNLRWNRSKRLIFRFTMSCQMSLLNFASWKLFRTVQCSFSLHFQFFIETSDEKQVLTYLRINSFKWSSRRVSIFLRLLSSCSRAEAEHYLACV